MAAKRTPLPRHRAAGAWLSGLLTMTGCWDLKSAADRRDAVVDLPAADAETPDVTTTPDAQPDAIDAATIDAPDVIDAQPDVIDAAQDRSEDATVDGGDASVDVVDVVAIDMVDVPAVDVPAVDVPAVDAIDVVTIDVVDVSAIDVVDVARVDAIDVVAADVVDAAAVDVADVPTDVPRPTVPQPVWPPSASRVYRADPMFEVEVPAGADGVTISVCSAPDCAAGHLVQTFRAAVTGTRAAQRPTAALAAGRYWWRAVAMTGAMAGASGPTWRLRVVPRAGGTDAVDLDPLDVDNDGYDDLVVNCSGWKVYRGGAVYSGAALQATAAPLDDGLVATGDFDGDGYGDVATIPRARASGALVLHVFRGGGGGLSATPWSLSFESDLEVLWLASAGDFNRDGYVDLVLDRRTADTDARAVTVVYGGASAMRVGPSLRGLSSATTYVGAAGAGDLDADGAMDLVVGVPGAAGSGFEGRSRVFTRGALGAGMHSATLGLVGTPWPSRDVNGDGRSDVAIARVDYAQLFFQGAGSPQYTSSSTRTSPAIAPTNVNGDGFDDAFYVAHYDASQPFVGSLAYGGTSGYIASHLGISRADANEFGSAVATGDYDNDGRSDVVIRVATAAAPLDGTLWFFHGISGGFSSSRSFTASGCSPAVAW